MKHPYILPLIACGLLCACGPSSAGSDASDSSASTSESSSKSITVELPVYESFAQITNLGSCDIDITPGPCKVTATGDSVAISRLIYDVSSNALTISMPQTRCSTSTPMRPTRA